MQRGPPYKWLCVLLTGVRMSLQLSQQIIVSTIALQALEMQTRNLAGVCVVTTKMQVEYENGCGISTW